MYFPNEKRKKIRVKRAEGLSKLFYYVFLLVTISQFHGWGYAIHRPWILHESGLISHLLSQNFTVPCTYVSV